MGEIHFGIIGGDRRSAELARLLRADGWAVRTWQIAGQGIGRSLEDGEEELDQALRAGTVILPLPLCGPDGRLGRAGGPIGATELLDRLAATDRPGRRILAGMVPPGIDLEARARGLELLDYFRRESVTVANAAATADAAVTLAVERREASLCGERCLVLGFGRIGKILCARLKGIGARPAAAARRPEDRAWIRAYGYEALDIGALSGHLDGFPVVFDTVPVPVLDRALLSELPRGCLFLELASRPGPDPADGLDVVSARSLPGRLVPRTAAAVLRDGIYEIWKEDGSV